LEREAVLRRSRRIRARPAPNASTSGNHGGVNLCLRTCLAVGRNLLPGCSRLPWSDAVNRHSSTQRVNLTFALNLCKPWVFQRLPDISLPTTTGEILMRVLSLQETTFVAGGGEGVVYFGPNNNGYGNGSEAGPPPGQSGEHNPQLTGWNSGPKGPR
jgi:hypothetical protein